jgi:hypothetical protein
MIVAVTAHKEGFAWISQQPDAVAKERSLVAFAEALRTLWKIGPKVIFASNR